MKLEYYGLEDNYAEAAASTELRQMIEDTVKILGYDDEVIKVEFKPIAYFNGLYYDPEYEYYGVKIKDKVMVIGLNRYKENN